jgi:hypothetical protein
MEANHDRDQARFVFQKMLFSIREQQTLNIVELIANLVPAVVDIVQQRQELDYKIRDISMLM